jgi:hypothetical protein
MPTAIDVTERTCIGRVREHHPLSDGTMTASLDPIAISGSDGTSWEIDGFDVSEHFPHRGRIWWYKAPSNIRDGSVWELVVEDHPYKKDDEHREKFQVDNAKGPSEIVEVMDLRSVGKEKEVRDLLLGDGFRFPLRPIGNRVYLLIKDGELLGPFEVVPTASDPSLYTLADVASDKLVKIDVWEAPGELRDIDFSGTKRLPMPPGNRPFVRKVDAFKNWEPDHLLLTRSLKWLVEHDADTMKALCLNTRKVIKVFVDDLEKHSLDKEEFQVGLARKERLLELRDLVEGNAEVLETAANVLFGSEKVQKELREKVAAETDRLRKSEQQRIADELKAKKAELAEATRKSTEQNERLKKLEKEYKAAEAQLKAKMKPYSEELAKRLEEVAKEPHKAFSQLAFLKSIFGSAPTQGCYAGHDSVMALPLERNLLSRGDAANIEEIGQFMKRLGLRLLSRGINDVMSAPMTAAFLSGRVPMLDGLTAYPAIEAFAETVAGMKPLWIPVGGSLYEVQDIFGREDGSGRFVFHAAGLLPLLVEARKKPDTMFVVVLDGFNRSSADSYLFPIIQCIRDPGREIPIRSVIRSDGGTMSGFISSIDWPANVLLALIPSMGAMTIPVSSDLMREVIPLVFSEDSSVDEEGDPVPPISAVSSATWRKWRQDAKKAEKAFGQDEGRYGKGIAEFVAPLHGGATVVGMDARDKLLLDLVSGAIPEILRRKENPESILANFSVDASASIRAMQILMARLGG